MSEETITSEENSASEFEQHYHHHRSHSSDGHRHRRHHHSGSSHSEHHGRRSSSDSFSRSSRSHRGKRSIFKRIKHFFKKLSRKLTLDTDTYIGGIKKLANSQKSDSKRKYTIISRRVSFCAIILALVCYSVATLLSGEESRQIRNATNTPSENSMLKIQVMDLEQKNALLKQELDRYKELYGELDEAK